MIPPIKPFQIARILVIALLLLAAGFVVPRLLALPGTAADTTNGSPTSTNAAPVATNAASGATNAASASPAAAPGATNATASATNAAPATDNSEAPAPGEMSGGPAAEPSEPIGPPAPGGNGEASGEIMPYQTNPGGTNNPAVQDITNNPNATTAFNHRKLPFYFGLNVGEMYDDNIFISPDNQRKSSFITHITPSIDYELGDPTASHMNYLNIYFAPSIYIYHNRDNTDRTDYVGDIYYQYTWTRLQFGIDQNYQHLTDASLDEGKLVSRNIYTTKLTSSYAYNDDLSLYGTATQSINNYPGITINEWDVDTYALYQVLPKLSLGAGPRFAFLDITGAPNETHQDFLFRLLYVPDERFTVSFDGGAEYLQYQGDGADRVLPIFDARLTYSLFEDTSLFLQAGRTVENSYDLNGDLFDYTTVAVGATQHFLHDFAATATGGYAMSQYQSTPLQGSSEARRDNYFYGKASVEWDPNAWLKVEASYQWSKDNSTLGQFSFTDNQIDLQSSVKF